MNLKVSNLLSFNILAFFILVGGFSHPSSAGDWKLVAEKSDTKVYTRKSNTSDIKEIRIITNFQSDIKTLQEVLSDVDFYPSWVFKCINSEKISDISSNEFHYYLITDMPYPISNRDVVVYTKNWMESDAFFSKSTADPLYISEKSGLVRVPTFSSSWKVTPTITGGINIEYEVSTDPGGYLPDWVINLGITKGPLNTMSSLKKEVEERYQNK